MNNKYTMDLQETIDRVTAERDAALGREADLVERNSELRESLQTQTLIINSTANARDALQLRLNEADELACERTASLLECEIMCQAAQRRVEVLEGLLRRTYEADLAGRHEKPYNVSKLMDDIEADLNPRAK